MSKRLLTQKELTDFREIVTSNEYDLIITCMNESKGADAVNKIKNKTKISDILYRESAQNLASQWRGPLNLLMNVASQTPRQRTETKDGVEVQFATNVLGYFRMIKAFTPFLEDGAPSRVVNVASYWTGDFDISDLEMRRRPYDSNAAYKQSKAAERMLTVAFAKRLKDKGIVVNCVHPGDVDSNLSRDLGFGGSETPEEGAATPLYAATSKEGGEVTAL